MKRMDTMRKTILLLAVAGLMLIASTGRAWPYSESDTDTWLGLDAAHSLAAGNYWGTFIGYAAGYSNTTGAGNSFLGAFAGLYNTTGSYNSFMGARAGYYNTAGTNNVFLGYGAGWGETGSNKLYIDNCYSGVDCTEPFIYGEFDTRKLQLDGSLGIGLLPSYGVDVSGGAISKSQLHFSLAGTDTGGWITAVGENNFWLSSGAVWDQLNGGWVQKSADEKAIMAGSGSAGYRVLTRSGCAVGTACTTTTRMTINYSGDVGFGVAPSYPLHMASGAYVSVGGAWTDASSRDYKDDIEELGAAAAMSALEGLNPVTFKYKAGEDERHVGFIAEDVPELVATKDRKGMSPMDVVAVLTKVVQEKSRVVEEQRKTVDQQQQVLENQQKTLENLATTVQRLEAEVNQLKARNMTAQN